MDPSTLLALVPEQYTLYAALLVIACKLVTVFVRPPEATSKWAPVFQVVTVIGLNLGWAANRLQVGKTGVMVARADAAALKASAGEKGIALVSPSPIDKPG